MSDAEDAVKSPAVRSGEESKINPLVRAAAMIARDNAVMSGWMKKKKLSATNGGPTKLQKRYFMLLPGTGGVSYFVYYKTAAPDAPMLAAMDLSRAQAPSLVAPADEENGSDSVFAITWDRYREFQASSKAEAAAWVDAIAKAQAAARKAGIPMPTAAASNQFSPVTDKRLGTRPSESSRIKGGAANGGNQAGCCVVS